MENKRLFGLVCYLHRQMSRENNYIFADYGITPIQLNALMFTYVKNKNDEKVCQRDIERHVNLRPSSVSSLLSGLQNSGFINRSCAASDARTKYVTLTEKGKSICEENKLLMDKCDGLIQSALSEEEQETFKNLLKKIIAEIPAEKENQ